MDIRLGIMSALDAEIEQCLDRCDLRTSTERAGLTFHEGRWANHELVLVRSGVGKVNASLCAQLLIDTYGRLPIICTGSAGALNPKLDVGDIVVAKDCVQHDVSVEFLGLPRGQIPFTSHRFFETSERLRRPALDLSLRDRTIREGRVATGDVFVEEKDHRRQLRDELEGDCVDMESGAVGQVCTMNDVPFLAVRAISDHADGTSDIDFDAFLEDAARASSELVFRLLDALETDPDNSLPA